MREKPEHVVPSRNGFPEHGTDGHRITAWQVDVRLWKMTDGGSWVGYASSLAHVRELAARFGWTLIVIHTDAGKVVA